MAWRKAEVYILTVLLLVTAIFFAKRDSGKNVPFYFEVEGKSGENIETVHIWEQGVGTYYVFLPSHADLNHVNIRTKHERYFDNVLLADGMRCENLELDHAYSLSESGGSKTIKFVQSANIPAMYIDTISRNMEYIHQDKENKESGSLRLYTEDGILNYQGNLESMKMHGNNTQYSEKKPYSLKLSLEGDLLGMGKAKNWVLLSNVFDPTHLRNKVVLDFSRKFGMDYTPDSQWVDLYLNGEYVGLYLLCEKNEVHPQRVDLDKKGSCLVSMELEERLIEQNLPHIVTKKWAPLRVRYADMELDEVREIFQSAENAIWAEDGRNPDTGKHWSELIDLDSWARKYLIEEVFGNIDGGRVSQFFYVDGKNSSKKIYAGPVWDYDNSMANLMEHKKTTANMLYVNCPFDYFGSPWFENLCQDDVFFDYMVNLYQEEFIPLLTELVEEDIPQYARQIAQAVTANRIRWAGDYFQDVSAREETQKIQNYLTERIQFLNQIWIEKREYNLVSGNYDGRMANYAVFPGDRLPELPCKENYSWYIMGTETLLNPNEPIYENLQIECRENQNDKELSENIAE